ncbi:MAG: VOC family protein [Deltaproteobacteria bacterium]|nr:MAG: VOC family protein [Deltaproteobacteria bacterium]TMA55228.1 MAG: VOC family protein [Deltaproteobacteria bacterium]
MDRTLAAVCDHLLWGAADLHEAIAAFAARTGIRAAPGGRHPDLGTHNAIATLGPKRFLEIIAPDPTLRPGALAGRLASMKTPALIMWAARTSSAAATAARAEAAGYQAAVIEGRRCRPDGVVVRWTNVFVSGHGAGTLVPFFIEWNGRSHPADDGPKGLRLQALRAETPQAEALRAVLKALDVRLAVREAPGSRLVAVVDTPRGRIELVGS